MGTTAFAVVDFDASGVAAGIGAVMAGVGAVVAAVGAAVAGVGAVAAGALGCCARAAPVPRKPANASAREALKRVRFIFIYMSFGGN
jgi:hypothetical protein